MPAPDWQHGRAQTLLLASKILNTHEGVSPLTLIVDSIEQTAKPLLQDYMIRARKDGSEVIYLSFETLRKPSGCKHFFRGYEALFEDLQRDIRAVTAGRDSRFLILIDTLSPLASVASASISNLLFSLILPKTSLVAVLHGDQPITPPAALNTSAYTPSPLTVLRYIATTVFTVHSLRHLADEQRARLRSVAAPPHGLREAEEGVIQGFGSNSKSFVLDMEHRRKSGRSVGALFVVDRPSLTVRDGRTGVAREGTVTLLDEHPLLRQMMARPQSSDAVGIQEPQEEGVSFNLGLTDEQRRARDGIVLPYFDAQKNDEDVGEGGRILYDMGVEDDFDDEEDEI